MPSLTDNYVQKMRGLTKEYSNKMIDSAVNTGYGQPKVSKDDILSILDEQSRKIQEIITVEFSSNYAEAFKLYYEKHFRKTIDRPLIMSTASLKCEEMATTADIIVTSADIISVLAELKQ